MTEDGCDLSGFSAGPASGYDYGRGQAAANNDNCATMKIKSDTNIGTAVTAISATGLM